MRVTRRVAGSNTSTAALAVPSGFEPPAITTLPPTAATAGYRSGVGNRPTTWAT